MAEVAVKTVEDYMHFLPEERKEPMEQLRQVIMENIPNGFEEAIQYKMPAWVVPHSIFPDGYHCDTSQPLPFMSIASQKHFIGLYHMGVYAIPELMKWWQDEYAKSVPSKLDMGKSCVRFKKMDQIPFKLVGELASKIQCQEWIDFYTANIRR